MYVRNPDRETPFLSFVRLYCQIDYCCKSLTFLLSVYFIYYCILGLTDYTAAWQFACGSRLQKRGSWICVFFHFLLPSVLPYFFNNVCVCVCVYVQLYPTLCNPMDCNPPGSSCPWDFLGKKTGMGCHFLLQGISLIQGPSPYLLHLLHSRQILNHWATIRLVKS